MGREISEEYKEVSEAGVAEQGINGLVQAGRCWNNKLCDDMVVIKFEQSKTEPSVP